MEIQLDQNYLKTRATPMAIRSGTTTRHIQEVQADGRPSTRARQPALTLAEVAEATGLAPKILASVVMCLRQTGAPHIVKNLLARTQIPDPLGLIVKVFGKNRLVDETHTEGGIAKSCFEVLESDESGMVQLKAFLWHEQRRDLFLKMHRRGLIRIRVDFWQGGQLWRTTYEFIIEKDIKVRVRKVRSRVETEISWPDDSQTQPFNP